MFNILKNQKERKTHTHTHTKTTSLTALYIINGPLQLTFSMLNIIYLFPLHFFFIKTIVKTVIKLINGSVHPIWLMTHFQAHFLNSYVSHLFLVFDYIINFFSYHF